MENESESTTPQKQPEVEMKARTADIQVAEEFNFSKFMLSDQLLRSLNQMNFIKPSPIQLKVIPLAKCGLDLILQAKSGTGKTLAFAICLLETYNDSLKFPQSLVIVPTREIAVQTVGVLNELGKNIRHFKACEFIGGTEITNDRKKIQTSKVVVGTPGRILHLIKNEVFNVSNLKTLVLDEADKLLEGGHMGKDVREIMKLMHQKIQIIAATATVTDHLEKFLKQAMKNPIGITPKHEIPVLLGIKQFVKVFPKEDSVIALMNQKIDELNNIFKRIQFKQALLFTDSQSKTESYGIYLNKYGWKNQVINGAQDQSERLKVLDNLVKFKCRILITTDLMARGIDIDNINLIVNLDLPYDCFTYLHRIGRAGRFGSHGLAITFINGEDDLIKFQKMLGDIGGERLKAMKYPDESIKYDFWDFDPKNGGVLETVAGISEKSTSDDCVEDQEDTVMNNIALLEITRRLVDDKSSVASKKFDLEAMLDEYERNTGEPEMAEESQQEDETESEVTESEQPNAQANGTDENIFLKVIEDLKLYDGEIPESDVSRNGVDLEDVEPPAAKEVRKVIFQRPVIEDDEMGPLSSDSEAEENSESDESEVGDEEAVSDADIADEPVINQGMPEQSTSHHQNLHNSEHQDNPYSQYIASQYSVWSHIYQFQLANIQSYIESTQK